MQSISKQHEGKDALIKYILKKDRARKGEKQTKESSYFDKCEVVESGSIDIFRINISNTKVK